MIIDCDRCEVRGVACGDCVVTVLLGAPPEGVVLDHAERAAIGVLAEAGMVPPLRLVTGRAGRGGATKPERGGAALPERGGAALPEIDGSDVPGCESGHPRAADTG